MRYLFTLAMMSAISVPCSAFVLQNTEISGLQSGTVSGWVVDANSWLGHGARGEDHRSCAVGNAGAGTPLVILTDDGSVVYPVQLHRPAGTWASNRLLVAYADQRVTVIGKLVKRGRERGIEVEVVTADRGPAAETPMPVRRVGDTTIAARVADLNSWLGKGLPGPENRESAQSRGRAGKVFVLVGDDGSIIYPVAAKMHSGPAATDLLVYHDEDSVLARGTLIQRGPASAMVIESVSAAEPGGTGGDPNVVLSQEPK